MPGFLEVGSFCWETTVTIWSGQGSLGGGGGGGGGGLYCEGEECVWS